MLYIWYIVRFLSRPNLKKKNLRLLNDWYDTLETARCICTFYHDMYLSFEISRRRRGMNNANQNNEQSKSNTPHSKHSSKEKKYADLKGNINEH